MSNYPGSRWWTFDFHNHTPGSSDYNVSEKTALTPRDWLLTYMRANIDCVAITDHNSGDWIDRLQTELRAMQLESSRADDFRELHLFPGIEITSAEGLHVLAVFDPSENSGKIHAVKALAACKDHQNNAESICEQGAVQICQHIRSLGGVAILAHAEEINGIFEGAVDNQSGVFCQRHGSREVDQVLAVCDAIESHDTGSPSLLHFATRSNGIALVDGSDAHRTSNAGLRFVWIKMAKPSIEGLRLALIDPESSLLRPTGPAASAPPMTPGRRIVSFSVSQLYLRRQGPLEATFSPWFNSIIGGRGSGKSTVLETIRLALARDIELNELGDESDVYRAFKRFSRIAGGGGNSGMIIPNTTISVCVEKAEVGVVEAYRYSWAVEGFSVQRQDENGGWAETGLNQDQARLLFPVKIFSQKQIFELADRPSALLTYIDSAPEVDYESWLRRHEELRSAVRELRVKERFLISEITRKAQLVTELKEVSRKTLAYQQLKVADQVKVFRDNQASMSAVDDLILKADAVVAEFEQILADPSPCHDLTMAQIAIKTPDSELVTKVAADFIEGLAQGYEQVRSAVRAMRTQVDNFKISPEVQAFQTGIQSALANYRAEVEKLKAEGVGTAQDAEVALKRKQKLETDLANVAKQESDLEKIKHGLVRAYGRLKYHRRQLTSRRQEFVNAVLSPINDLRIRIDGQADVGISCASFRSALRLQDGTFVEDILGDEGANGLRSGILGKLISTQLHDPIHRRVTSLKFGILDRSKEVLGESVHGRLLNALSRLSHDDDDALLEWFPEDKVVVEYRRDSKSQFQSLDRASAGEKTSAILSFLLAHGDEPLLLDQPEDDLDNALVYSLVVRQIRGNKSRRQIIVVTHNPNIVVNGDAELVMPMEFKGGQIHLNGVGGLQERAVREKICEIMEGGKEAFRQRYKRILKDLEATS